MSSASLALSQLADAAFREAAKKVMRRAKETKTSIVIWEEGRIQEIPYDELDVRFGELLAKPESPPETSETSETVGQ
jgi:hypothetical protein